MTDRASKPTPLDPVPSERVSGGDRTHQIEHLKNNGRFRMLIDGREVAVLDYRRLPGIWNIVHTYTAPASRGHGYAGELLRASLDAARAAGIKIIPTCPYVRWWVYEHEPTYQDLVATR